MLGTHFPKKYVIPKINTENSRNPRNFWKLILEKSQKVSQMH